MLRRKDVTLLSQKKLHKQNLNNLHKRIFSLVLLAAIQSAAAWALSVDNLRVESLKNPSGIDSKEPHFSWQLQSE